MKKTLFGTLPNGKAVHLYTLKSEALELRVLDYGCRIQALIFDGKDMVCGYDSLEDYLADDSYQGALVGRVANRIGGGSFTLGGKTYQLEKNDGGKHHLHGIFSHTVWQVEEASDAEIVFSLYSPSEDEGYPGNVRVTATYRLTDNALVLDYQATTDEDTPISLTNHAYFNIDGIGAGPVLDHELQINADRISIVDGDLIPSGEYMDVSGSAYDFREFHKIGARFDEKVDGYDTNFVLNRCESATLCGVSLWRAASLRSAAYQLDCYTDTPCVQIYTANFLGNGPTFKYGVKQERQHAVCLETQYEPDAVNRGEGILPAGKTFHHTTIYTLRRR